MTGDGLVFRPPKAENANGKQQLALASVQSGEVEIDEIVAQSRRLSDNLLARLSATSIVADIENTECQVDIAATPPPVITARVVVPSASIGLGLNMLLEVKGIGNLSLYNGKVTFGDFLTGVAHGETSSDISQMDWLPVSSKKELNAELAKAAGKPITLGFSKERARCEKDEKKAEEKPKALPISARIMVTATSIGLGLDDETLEVRAIGDLATYKNSVTFGDVLKAVAQGNKMDGKNTDDPQWAHVTGKPQLDAELQKAGDGKVTLGFAKSDGNMGKGDEHRSGRGNPVFNEAYLAGYEVGAGYEAGYEVGAKLLIRAQSGEDDDGPTYGDYPVLVVKVNCGFGGGVLSYDLKHEYMPPNTCNFCATQGTTKGVDPGVIIGRLSWEQYRSRVFCSSLQGWLLKIIFVAMIVGFIVVANKYY
jgi:hypothetical protein